MNVVKPLLLLLKNYSLVKKLTKFATIGFLTWLIEVTLLALMVELGDLYYLRAAAIAIVFSNTFNFTFNKLWTFQNKEKKAVKVQLPLFIAQKVVGVAVYLFLMYTLVDMAGFWYIYSQIICGSLIGIFNFTFCGLVVFKQRAARKARKRI
ncbi:GtrA family protein [Candidatus Woesearchaeota archaeon]|jgi:putative flippase GtrA|nr:GtrA family protein [Candidatus Woesearchaeota archaeon]MBT3537740.1 GtrA family protein [Candidatus Woesearchaeota archaeon]MBT4697871.1 GtrA family protein [Candidatus Woesearchaeota archaeon]MBT4717469.1 GtrA family protein [Candidatus Woesearchaeota archaeon]MBT7105409.1 GtrA family protein [Candidatus Woesearchaeota archaeon]